MLITNLNFFKNYDALHAYTYIQSEWQRDAAGRDIWLICIAKSKIDAVINLQKIMSELYSI